MMPRQRVHLIDAPTDDQVAQFDGQAFEYGEVHRSSTWLLVCGDSSNGPGTLAITRGR